MRSISLNIFLCFSLIVLIKQPKAIAQSMTGQYIWFGVDFSKARMIGPEHFKNPYDVVWRLFGEWNRYFITEPSKFDLTKINGHEFKIDLDIVTDRNAAVNPDSLVIKSTYTLHDESLVEVIKGYRHNYQSGTGAVFIVEAFNGNEDIAFIHVVFFDLSTNEILTAKKVEGYPYSELGIKNYWIGAIHDVLKRSKKVFSELGNK